MQAFANDPNALKSQTGDIIRLDAIAGTLTCLTAEMEERTPRTKDLRTQGFGRELFNNLRHQVTSSEDGASFIL